MADITPLLDADRVLQLQRRARGVHLSTHLVGYVQDLLEVSRLSGRFAFGLSPRAGLALLRAARAWALLAGRDWVLPEDVQQVLPHVAGHRLRHADTLAEVDPAELATVFQSVPVPA